MQQINQIENEMGTCWSCCSGIDYNGLYAIPNEYFREVNPGLQEGDDIADGIRAQVEMKVSKAYERLYQSEFIDVFSYSSAVTPLRS